MVTGEICRITVSYATAGGSTPQNVFHTQLLSGDITDAQALIDLDNWVNAGWLDEWEDRASEDAEGIGADFDIMNVDGTVNRSLGASSYTTHQGTLAQDVEPPAVSYFMFAPTALPKIRGRKFVPGVTEQGVADGLITPSALSSLTVLADFFINTYVNGSNSYGMGVLSTVLQEFVPFIGSYVLSDDPAYQRRRKAGVGI